MSSFSDIYASAMEKTSSALANFLVRFRLMLLIVFTAATLFFGYHASFLEMSPGFDKSIPFSHEYMDTYKKYRDNFGGANIIILALMQKEGDIFNVPFFEMLEKATLDVLFIKGVDRPSTLSLFTPQVSYIQVNEEGFVGARVIPGKFKATDESVAQVRLNYLKSPYVGQLGSHDFRGALIKAELVENDPETGEPLAYRGVSDAVEEIRQKYTSENVDVHIIGFAKFIVDVIDGALGVVMFFVIALVITFVMLYFYASSLQITVLAIGVALVAVVWQLGLVRLLGFGIDPLSIMVPFLILSIGVSHAIQMTNTWKLEILKGIDSIEAARNSFNKLFIPGATALLANAVGFGVIMLIDITIIHELGITASIGVAVMIITNKFLLPVLLCYARMPEKTIERIREKVLDRERPVFRYLSRFAVRKNTPVVLVAAVVLGGLGYVGGKNLIIGDPESGAPEFWPDSRYNRDIDTVINNFNIGIDELTVMVETVFNGCVSHDIVETIDRFIWHVQGVEGVHSVSTLVSSIKGQTVGLTEAYPKFYSLPRSPYALGSTMRKMELAQKLFNNDCSVMPVRIFLTDHKAGTLRRVVGAVKEFNQGNSNERIKFKLASGSAGVMAATNEAVAEAEATMLYALFASVGLLCFLTFLSWRAAVCILLPLALVSVSGNAVMVMLDIGLKVSTLPVVALGVGVGVDYGIYLFARTQVYLRQGMDLQEAFYESLKSAGTAVIFTASTMTIGVATWYFSALKFQADMGILLAYMFFVNMVGAIVLLPALASWLINVEEERNRKGGIAH